jgi:hypothetical protein
MIPQNARLRASIMRVRDTNHTKIESLFARCVRMCFYSNPLIPTSSVVSQSVQVCKENEQEMFVHHTTPLNVKSENTAAVQNQFVAAINMKHEDEGVKKFRSATHCTYTSIKTER